MQKVQLIGNVGGSPDIKTFNGKRVASFSLATTETWKDKDGNKQSSTEWHNINIWGSLANVVENYVKKGSKIYLEGKIKTDIVENNGEKKYFTKIVCNSMELLGSVQSNKSGLSDAVIPSGENVVQDNVSDLPF